MRWPVPVTVIASLAGVYQVVTLPPPPVVIPEFTPIKVTPIRPTPPDTVPAPKRPIPPKLPEGKKLRG